jgi:nitrate reductase beta subunit
LADDENLVEEQRKVILDPFDSKVIEEAKKEGISDDWIDAAQRSPVYKLAKNGISITTSLLNLERCQFVYIPPLAPILTSAGKNSPSTEDIFDMEKPSTGPLLVLMSWLSSVFLLNILQICLEQETKK